MRSRALASQCYITVDDTIEDHDSSRDEVATSHDFSNMTTRRLLSPNHDGSGDTANGDDSSYNSDTC